MIRLRKETGFSILEVLISAFIFIIVVFGVYSSVSRIRFPAEESTEELYAATFGSQILQQLHASVDQRIWNSPTSNLAIGTHTAISSDGKYNATYNVSDVNPYLRKVEMTVTWNATN